MKNLMLILFLNIALFQSSFCEKCKKYDSLFNFQIKPSVFNLADDNKYSFGLEFNFEGNCQPYTGKAVTYGKELLIQFKTAGLFITDKKLNPQNIRGEFLLGGSINLSGPQIADRSEEEGVEIITQNAFDYGQINGGFNAGYETDQSLDNRNVTVGAELTYVFIKNESLKAFIPSLHAYYEYVSIDKTSLSKDKDNYSRFRAAASWKIPFGKYLPQPLNPFFLHLDARYLKEFDRSAIIEKAEQDQAHYIAGFLNYTFKKPVLFDFISGVFIKVADGRIPPAIREATQVHLGIIFMDR